jgi:hypothetical protein
VNAPVVYAQPALPAQQFSYAELEKMALAIAKSKLFGMETPEQALALCLIAQAEGLHPATAAQEYHIIQGRAARKAEAMLARFQRAGGKVEWHAYGDDGSEATFSHPVGGSVRVRWDMARANKVKSWNSKKEAWEPLADKANYRYWSREMFRSRCISEGVRTVYPACLGAAGIYTPEEVADMAPGEPIDVTPTATVTVEQPQKRTEPSSQTPSRPTSPGEAAPKTGQQEHPPAGEAPAGANGNGKPITEGAKSMIRAALKRAALSELDLAGQWGEIDHITFAKVNDVLDWIKANPGKAA